VFVRKLQGKIASTRPVADSAINVDHDCSRTTRGLDEDYYHTKTACNSNESDKKTATSALATTSYIIGVLLLYVVFLTF